MKGVKSIILAGLVSLFVIGCGSNNSTDSSGSGAITQAQAKQVALQLYSVAILKARLSVNGDSSTSLSSTYTCPLGGTIAITGSVNRATSAEITETPSNCDVSPSIINGDPNIVVNDTYSSGNYSSVRSGSIVGTVTVKPDSATPGVFPSGTCQVNLNYNDSLSTGTGESCSVGGTVCNQTVSANCN